MLSNANYCAGPHIQTHVSLIRSVMGFMLVAISGTNLDEVSKPHRVHSSVSDLGSGKFLMALTLSRSGQMPLLLSRAKSTSCCLNWHISIQLQADSLILLMTASR